MKCKYPYQVGLARAWCAELVVHVLLLGLVVVGISCREL